MPSTLLIDTNIAIYLATRHPTATRYVQHLEGQALLFPDLETCAIWATISASSHRRGRPRQDNDLWIAATALRHGLPLVTHNRRDFVDIPDLLVISKAPSAH